MKITLQPIGGFQWPCPNCKAMNQVHVFTACVTCPHCGLVTDAAIESDTLACLTERERQIACLIAEGNTNNEIAARLFLSVGTVQNYTSVIYAKLNVSNRAEAAALVTRSQK